MLRLLLPGLLAAAFGALAPPALAGSPSKHRVHARDDARYAGNAQAMRFADEVARQQGLDPAWTRRVIGQARRLAQVQKLMQPPAAQARKNWAAYRERFIEPVRIGAGVRFWQEHREALARAERAYGVPPEIVVGILGVETLYGRYMGNFRVIDALATLAFDYPAEHPRAAERAAWFRGELAQFLALQRRQGADPLEALGSFAGAMGLPQFMPGSVARWAVDFDGDGRIDLRESPEDAIGSVARYFQGFGWQPGLPPYYPVRFDPQRLDMDALLAPDILPSFTLASLHAKGALPEGEGLESAGPFALVELQNGEAPPSYVAGTQNFYVITRYNASSYYAMAVIELGRAVRAAVQGLDALAQREAAQAPTPAEPASAEPTPQP